MGPWIGDPGVYKRVGQRLWGSLGGPRCWVFIVNNKGSFLSGLDGYRLVMRTMCPLGFLVSEVEFSIFVWPLVACGTFP